MKYIDGLTFDILYGAIATRQVAAIFKKAVQLPLTNYNTDAYIHLKIQCYQITNTPLPTTGKSKIQDIPSGAATATESAALEVLVDIIDHNGYDNINFR